MGFKVKFDKSPNEITLKNQISSGTRIDNLNDVDVTGSQANGSILVYNSSTDTYIQRDILSFDRESGAFKLDGGSF